MDGGGNMDWIGALTGTAIGAGSGGIPFTSQYQRNVIDWEALGASQGASTVAVQTSKLGMAAIGAAATLDKKKGISAGYNEGLGGVFNEVKNEAAAPLTTLLILGGILVVALIAGGRE